jgi:hypothetical protein
MVITDVVIVADTSITDMISSDVFVTALSITDVILSPMV